jgi:AbiV family abortive infection protein
MPTSDEHQKLITIRAACLGNAEAILSIAEREIGKGGDHVCFHLALLALEEIGKSILATINYATATAQKGDENLVGAMDDHIKKIFWALWGGMLLRDEEFSKESIEENQHLATSLHERRLASLYTDDKNPLPVEARIDENDAKMITELTRARLEYEKGKEFLACDEVDIQNLTWYFSAIEDSEMRKQVFSRASRNKLAELGSGREWLKWLRQLFQTHEEEMMALARKELERKKPEEHERFDPKYQLRVRIQTSSHSIRNNAFTKWNAGVEGIKFYKSDRKDPKKLIKGEFLVDFYIPKSMHLGNVYEHGLFMAKTTVLALNVATLGIFWWNVQKDVDKYYEEILDLEVDPKGTARVFITPDKRLHVNFDEAKMVLDERLMTNVYHVFAFFFREFQRLEVFLKRYAMGLALFSKTDIHLRFEVNAFDEFYEALRETMKTLGDWDGESDFKAAVKAQLEEIGERGDLDQILDLGQDLVADETKSKLHPITLTEVVTMKMYCDYYMQLKAREYFEILMKAASGPETRSNRRATGS